MEGQNAMHFNLIYSGPGLESNDIDAAKLGSSLLAVHDILNEANFIINGGHAKVKVKVKASFRTGSFGIDFEVAQHAFERLLYSSKIANAITVFTGVIGLIKLVKWLKGQKADKIHESEDGSFLVYKGDKYFKTEKKIIDLYQSYKLRKNLEATVDISEYDGVDEVTFNYTENNEKKYETVTASEAKYFTYTEDIEVANETEKTQILEIISLSFKAGVKWKVSDGANTFNITIRDVNFISQIEERELSFQKHDKVKAKVIERQFLEKNTLKKEYLLEEVIEHIKQPRQDNLPGVPI